MKFSIIIPFYNAEPWIGRCLESCLAQDVPEDEVELILVDDGSVDGGRSVAEAVLAGRGNVHILSQRNSGQAAARNRALDIATGEFVWFVDADDWIAPYCLERIEAYMADSDILAISGADWKDGQAVRRFGWKVDGVLPGRELMLRHKINVGTPFSIYRRSFLEANGLRFLEGIYHEDADFAPRAYFACEQVSCTDDILYYVYLSEGSTTRSANPKRVYDSIGAVQRRMSEFCNSEQVPAKYRPCFDNLISSDFNHALKQTFLFDDATNSEIGEYVYRNRYLLKHLRRSTITKFRIEGLVFSLFPKHIVTLYRMFKRIM